MKVNCAALPSELLERRPDVREAEENLRAANESLQLAQRRYDAGAGTQVEGGAKRRTWLYVGVAAIVIVVIVVVLFVAVLVAGGLYVPRLGDALGRLLRGDRGARRPPP